MIKGLIFDFDGLILDTELPVYQAWQEVYGFHNCELPLSQWVLCLGTTDEMFDPILYLESLLDRKVDSDQVIQMHRSRSNKMIQEKSLLPGVEDYISIARLLGVRLAVASSSSGDWVRGHLARFDLLNKFDVVRTREDVVQVKPSPDLFLSALEGLSLQPGEAIVLEDSMNGIKAAKAAGIYCVAVPNQISVTQDLSQADMQLSSLSDLSLQDLITLVQAELEKGGRSEN